jgi:hypothetical protein
MYFYIIKLSCSADLQVTGCYEPKIYFFRRFRSAKSDYQLYHVCMSLRLSVRTEQLSSHERDFHESLYLTIFWKYVEKIQV